MAALMDRIYDQSTASVDCLDKYDASARGSHSTASSPANANLPHESIM